MREALVETIYDRLQKDILIIHRQLVYRDLKRLSFPTLEVIEKHLKWEDKTEKLENENLQYNGLP